MKNHIVFKFIAIVLCAACLMGAVGGAGGILVLMEANLYQRTAEEAYRNTLENYAEGYANDMAVRYASQELGNASAAMIESLYGSYWYADVFHSGRIGYVLYDEAGNVLVDNALSGGQKTEYAFTFQPVGNYAVVLSEMTAEEYRGTAELPVGVTTQIGEDYVYNAIPENGAEVYFIEVQFADGSGWGVGSPDEPMGFLAQHPDGTVEYLPTDDYGPLENADVTGIQFLTRDNTSIYEAYSPSGVLAAYGWQENTGFTLQLRDLTETVMTMDAIPMGGCAVTRVFVSYADGFEESVGGAPDIGYLDYDGEGRVRFVPYDAGAFTYHDAPVIHITFYDDANNEMVYEARDPDGVGWFFYQGEELLFLADRNIEIAEAPVEETVPPVTEVPAETEQTLQGFVNVHSNIYVSADLGSQVVGFIAVGSTVDILPQEDGVWGWIPGSGWVLLEGITLRGEAVSPYVLDPTEETIAATEETESPTEEPFWAEVQKNLYIQNSPDGNADVIGTFHRGDIVHVIRTVTTGGVKWALTDQGWVSMDQLVRVEMPVSEESSEYAQDTTEVTEAVLETMAEESIPAATEAVIAAAEYSGGNSVVGYYDSSTRQQMHAEYVYEPLPAYTVELRLAEGAFRYENDWALVRSVYALRDELPYILGISLLLFAVFAVYLCCAAGRKPGTTEIRAGGLNRIPLDLYGAAAVGGVVALVAAGVEGTGLILRYQSAELGAVFLLLCAYGASLLVVGFCFACAAQFKTSGRFWWHNSLCGFCLRLTGKLCKWLLKFARWATEKCETWLWPAFVRLCKGIFKVVKMLLKMAGNWLLRLVEWLQKGGDWLGRKLNRFFSLLPLTWQWLLVGFGMFLLMAIVFATNGEEVLVVICIGICISIILYGAHCFGCLLESAKRMSKGDLNEKVDDKLMVGSFKDFAGELNSLADVAVIAAQKQLKSERMKTELITNVSHDIKTPLTSIINYVDLLQKPHTAEDQEKYLEVLDRQSQRLKKLIDDLMEMSKASTGNLAVDVTMVDAGEAVNQALGEFADKLDKAQLISVFRQPEQQILMMADGRLVWRVMSNLLSNAVKYALPGTRVYVDLQKLDNKVIISMKNISREELNVEADELLERFVRGDASRNTEGSGLGLNIAQSLMELQKGQLQILVDGDLFKVTLIFPGVE